MADRSDWKRLKDAAAGSARRLRARSAEARRRAGAWRRGRIDPHFAPARRVLAPATTRVGAWRDRLMASEMAPPRLHKPGLPEKITAAVFVLLIAALVAFLAWFDWNHLRGPISRYASARLERDVRITGDLDVDALRWSPTATVQGLKISEPDWAGDGETVDIDRLTVAVKLLPLLGGRIDMPLVRAETPRLRLISDAQGRKTWEFGDGDDSRQGMELPLIRRFVIQDGRIVFRDEKRRLTLDGTINSSETAGGGAGSAFRLDGRGTLNGNPLTLTVRGGPLINVRRDQPYDFVADLRGGATRLTARGAVTRPFDLGHFQAALTLEGNDLADLYYVTGLTMPNTPPYQVEGDLRRDDAVWRFSGFSGRVGDSDLSGDVTVRTDRERPHLAADVRSRSLDLDDLAALTGGAPAVGGGETASPEQRAVAAALNAQGRLLPDAPLNIDRLRAMDADVRYRAASVKSNQLAVRQVELGVDLENAVLNIDPVAFQFASGRLNGTIRIDGRREVPYTTADLRLSGYPLQTIIPARNGAPTVTGALQARARLEGPGQSVRRFAANADGSVTLVVPRGTIRQAFAELLGINATKGLLLLLDNDTRSTELRCAVASFQARDGVLTARNVVIDTGVVLATGSGTVNLADETMNLRIDGQTKEARLVKLWSPILVRGRLRSPQVGVDVGEVVAQTGIAAALGALVAPLAAILPFVGPDLAEDANCAALIANAG